MENQPPWWVGEQDQIVRWIEELEAVRDAAREVVDTHRSYVYPSGLLPGAIGRLRAALEESEG